MPPEWLDTTSAPPDGKCSRPRTSERKYRLRNGRSTPITRSVRPGSHLVSSDGSISVVATRPPVELERVLVFMVPSRRMAHRPVASITRVSEDANSEEAVLVEQRDRILIITINRPQAKNAVNAAVSQGLADAMDRARRRRRPVGRHRDRGRRLLLRRNGPQGVRPRGERHRRGPRNRATPNVRRSSR